MRWRFLLSSGMLWNSRCGEVCYLVGLFFLENANSYLTENDRSSLVIDDLFTKSSIEAGTCVTYLYCVYQDEAKQTPENMMGTLLKQAISILHESNALPDKTIRFLQEKKAIPGDLSLYDICDLLLQVTSKFRKFYVCIDALDECKAEHRGELLQSLAGVLEKCGQECSASLFATGRLHVNRVENVQRHRGLGSLVHIYLEASRDGIRKYITHAIDMDDNNDCTNDILKAEILETIVNNSDKMLV